MVRRHCVGVRRWRRVGAVIFVLAFILFFVLSKEVSYSEDSKLASHRDRTTIPVFNWVDNPVVGCSGNFYGYAEEFVRLRYARINSKTKTFSIPCSDEHIPAYKFQYGYDGDGATPLQTLHANMQTYPIPLITSLKPVETTTIVVMRIEAHNLYHTMCEWYNVFLLSILLDFNTPEVEILFLDDRPPSPMDETWKTLFKTTHRYSEYNYNSAFTDLIWNIIGYESPLNFHYQKKLPLVSRFRSFFLDAFKIEDTKSLNCDKLTVTLFLRRDYMTHPERQNITGGLVHRKFQNEDEIIGEIKNVFHGAELNIVVLEKLSMKEQLQIVTNTDVLIGMHGAGMAHIMFLPKHAVVFEMFPKYWEYAHYFKAFARWRHIKYFGWQNKNDEDEFPDFYTRIPLAVLRTHFKAMQNYICGE